MDEQLPEETTRFMTNGSPQVSNGLPQVSLDPSLEEWTEKPSHSFHERAVDPVSASDAFLDRLLAPVAPPRTEFESGVDAGKSSEATPESGLQKVNPFWDMAQDGEQIASPEGATGGHSPFPPPLENSVQPEKLTIQPPVMPSQDHQPMPASPSAEASSGVTEAEEAALWQRFLLVGGGIITTLFFGALLRNSSVFLGKGPASSPASVVSPTPNAVSPGLDTSSANPAPQPTNPSSITSPPPSPSGQPTAPPSPSQEQTNQTVLTEAKALIRTNQVSQFRQAIERASRIQPGQPLYSEAQESIQRWSLIILDTAEGRASQGRYREAIQAAQFIPKTQPMLYRQAQQSIARWNAALASSQKPSGTSPSHPVPPSDRLVQASKVIRAGEASSYSKAIGIARQIPTSAPDYPEAQRLIREWSQMILTLAQNRANRDNYTLAIQAAKLVPPGTPAYTSAQKSVNQWSQDLLALAKQRASQRRFRAAIRIAELIPDGSPTYKEAQRAISRWQQRRL